MGFSTLMHQGFPQSSYLSFHCTTKNDMNLNGVYKNFELFLSMGKHFFFGSEVTHISKFHMGHFQQKMHKQCTKIVMSSRVYVI